jgi:hypothetical protein
MPVQARTVSGHIFVCEGYRFDVASCYDFSIGIWNCSDSVIFVVFIFFNETRKGGGIKLVLWSQTSHLKFFSESDVSKTPEFIQQTINILN